MIFNIDLFQESANSPVSLVRERSSDGLVSKFPGVIAPIDSIDPLDVHNGRHRVGALITVPASN